MEEGSALPTCLLRIKFAYVFISVGAILGKPLAGGPFAIRVAVMAPGVVCSYRLLLLMPFLKRVSIFLHS